MKPLWASCQTVHMSFCVFLFKEWDEKCCERLGQRFSIEQESSAASNDHVRKTWIMTQSCWMPCCCPIENSFTDVSKLFSEYAYSYSLNFLPSEFFWHVFCYIRIQNELQRKCFLSLSRSKSSLPETLINGLIYLNPVTKSNIGENICYVKQIFRKHEHNGYVDR